MTNFSNDILTSRPHRRTRAKPRISLTPPLPPKEQEDLHHPWDKLPTTPHGKALTVGEIVQEYVNSIRWTSLTEGSKQRYLSVFRKFEKLLLYSGKNIYVMRAYKVDYSAVDYLHKILNYTKKPVTIRYYFCIMSNVWDFACRNGRVYINPWLRPRIKVSNERDITWTEDQVSAAINKAKELNYNVLALYLLMCYETAQRPWKDLRNLTWSSIKKDEEDNYHIDFEISKTSTHLLLPITDRVVKVLDAWPKISTYIFVDDHGERLLQKDVYKQFLETRKAAGLPQHLQMRDLRRTAITELAENGCSTLEIEAITGWRVPESVIRRYARVRLKTAQHALQKREQGRIQENPDICTEAEYKQEL